MHADPLNVKKKTFKQLLIKKYFFILIVFNLNIIFFI